MNRPIEFRGKRKDNGEWVYGSLVNCDMPIQDAPYIVNEDGIWDFDPATVGQYTGLKDKDGVKIFEGDIIDNESKLKWMIKWDDDDARFFLAYEHKESGVCRMNKKWILETKVKVIGTINTPELEAK